VRVLVFGLVVVPEQKRSYTRSLDEGQHSMSEQAEDVYRSKEEVAEALRDLKGEKGAWRLPSVGYEVSPPGCRGPVPFLTSCLQCSQYLEPPYLFWRVVLHRTADTHLVTALYNLWVSSQNHLAAGDTLLESILQNAKQQHELLAAEKRRNLEAAIASLPPQVLLSSTSHPLLQYTVT
jgi:hypothetical protein